MRLKQEVRSSRLFMGGRTVASEGRRRCDNGCGAPEGTEQACDKCLTLQMSLTAQQVQSRLPPFGRSWVGRRFNPHPSRHLLQSLRSYLQGLQTGQGHNSAFLSASSVSPTQLLEHTQNSSRICVQLSSVAQLCPTLCDPMDCSTPDLPVYH